MAWYFHWKARRLAAILVLWFCLVSPLGGEQAHASPTELPAGSTQVAKPPSTEDEDIPVAVSTPSETAMRHFQTGNAWWCVRMLWEIALPTVLLFTGLSARLRDLAFRLGRKRYFALCIYLLLLGLIMYAVSWPLDYYQGFVRPHAYGLSNQTFGKWFGDSLTALAVAGVVGVLFLWVPYWLLRKSPRRWWLYGGLAMIPFYFFGQLVAPVAIDPLFNQFTPLHDKALETKILALADRAGIHGSRIYEVNKSVDTRTVNAYVTGFMGTKRIVLWDTALQKLNDHELLFVMGHEMGHYVLNHVIHGILFLSALTLLALYFIHRTAGFMIARFGGRFRFDRLDDIASLPLLMLLTGIFVLLLSPIGLAYSRRLEHEADRFGLEITRFNHSAATGFVRLQEESLSVPWPGSLYTFLRSTHPSIGERIDFFNAYKPWKQGEPLKYGGLFEAGTLAKDGKK